MSFRFLPNGEVVIDDPTLAAQFWSAVHTISSNGHAEKPIPSDTLITPGTAIISATAPAIAPEEIEAEEDEAARCD